MKGLLLIAQFNFQRAAGCYHPKAYAQNSNLSSHLGDKKPERRFTIIQLGFSVSSQLVAQNITLRAGCQQVLFFQPAAALAATTRIKLSGLNFRARVFLIFFERAFLSTPPRSQTPQFAAVNGARAGGHQIAQGIGSIVAANALVVDVGFENITRPIGIVLEIRQALQEAGAVLMNEDRGQNTTIAATVFLEPLSPPVRSQNARALRDPSRGRVYSTEFEQHSGANAPPRAAIDAATTARVRPRARFAGPNRLRGAAGHTRGRVCSPSQRAATACLTPPTFSASGRGRRLADLTTSTWLRQGARMFAEDAIDHFPRPGFLAQQ